jgi:Flp pilus assembly protein TadG
MAVSYTAIASHTDAMTRRRRIDVTHERGQTAVEFALVAPIVIVLLLAVVQVGIAFNHYLTLTDATRAGARRATVNRLITNPSADAEQAVRTAASDLDQAKLKVTVTSTDWARPGSDVQVNASYPFEIDLLGWVVKAGSLTSTTTERLE